jgi:hypothetical protein
VVVLPSGELIGKCPAGLPDDRRQAMLDQAVGVITEAPYSASFPKRLFAVDDDGTIYAAETTNLGQSYHGFPYHGRLGKRLLAALRTIAQEKRSRDKVRPLGQEAHNNRRAAGLMTFDLDLAVIAGGSIHLTVIVDDEEVWPHPGLADPGSDFDPEDILAWLVDAWASVHLEQSWPIPFTGQQEPRSITGLLRAAEERWEDFGDSAADRVAAESDRVESFLYRHDLSQMKFAAERGPCFVMRQRGQVRMETSGQIFEGIDFKKFVEN